MKANLSCRPSKQSEPVLNRRQVKVLATPLTQAYQTAAGNGSSELGAAEYPPEEVARSRAGVVQGHITLDGISWSSCQRIFEAETASAPTFPEPLEDLGIGDFEVNGRPTNESFG